MNRQQFILVVAILVALVAGGAGVAWWKRASYQAVDTRVGQPLVAGLRIDEVAEVRVRDLQGAATLARGERGWTVKERGDFPADFDPVRDLLVRLAQLKIVQDEALTETIKARLQLTLPDPAARPEAVGLAVTLTGRDGKTIAELVLGKKTFRATQDAGPPNDAAATGRYVWSPANAERASVVSEPFTNVSAKPQQWLARELMRVERVKSVAALGADGRERWSVFKDSESSDWKWRGEGKLDPGKAQDASSALYALQIADAAVGVSDADAGLDKPLRIRAETFDGWRYELAIGKAGPEDRYYARSTVAGTLPEKRTPPKDEKDADKDAAEKAFADRKAALAAKLEREQAVSGRVVLIPKATLDPLLRERKALIAAPKPKDGKGKR